MTGHRTYDRRSVLRAGIGTAAAAATASASGWRGAASAGSPVSLGDVARGRLSPPASVAPPARWRLR